MEQMIMDNTPQPELTEELIKFMVDSRNENSRIRRNELLSQSDKYLLQDFPITPENLISIKEYRKALRDFSNNDFIIADFPF
jgi:hypothetical protein